LTKRKNRSVAITALARKLFTIAYLMLKNNEPYRYARPELMRKKFTLLKVIQPPRGKQRKPKQSRPGLVAVYRAAGLPPVTEPKQLPPGERRMLGEQRLEPFVEELYPESDSSSKEPAAAKKPKPLGRPKGRPG